MVDVLVHAACDDLYLPFPRTGEVDAAVLLLYVVEDFLQHIADMAFLEHHLVVRDVGSLVFVRNAPFVEDLRYHRFGRHAVHEVGVVLVLSERVHLIIGFDIERTISIGVGWCPPFYRPAHHLFLLRADGRINKKRCSRLDELRDALPVIERVVNLQTDTYRKFFLALLPPEIRCDARDVDLLSVRSNANDPIDNILDANHAHSPMQGA